MSRTAHWQPILETDHIMLIEDLGPWDVHRTITNDAENVVRLLAPFLRGRRLFYVDSAGDLDEIEYAGDVFIRFSCHGNAMKAALVVPSDCDR